MIVGLWDDDVIKYHMIPFSLSLMKLSAYYKKHNHLVVMCSEFEPERFTKFYIRKNWNDGEYPNGFFLPQCECGGRAFFENYKPLDEEIEACYPDKELYLKFIDKYQTYKSEQTFLNQQKNFEHIRLSLDEKTVWKDVDRTYNVRRNTKGIILHDYHLTNIENSFEKIQEILEPIPSIFRYVGMKYPVVVSTPEELYKWNSFNPTAKMYFIQYNGLLDDEVFHDFFIREIRKSIAAQFTYNVTATSSSENDFVVNILPKLYRQCIFLRSLNKKISLKYDNNFFIDKRWGEVIELINSYINIRERQPKTVPSFFSETYTLFRFISSPKYFFSQMRWNKEQMRELFNLVRTKSYETFKMFYETSKVELKGGQFVG